MLGLQRQFQQQNLEEVNRTNNPFTEIRLVLELSFVILNVLIGLLFVFEYHCAGDISLISFLCCFSFSDFMFFCAQRKRSESPAS